MILLVFYLLNQVLSAILLPKGVSRFTGFSPKLQPEAQKKNNFKDDIPPWKSNIDTKSYGLEDVTPFKNSYCIFWYFSYLC